jgi:ABC-type glycerol-3-phosphate transport system substrate-binding protein
MDERTSLSRRKLLHTLAGTGVIAAADLAWWDAPYVGPRKAWGAEPVRFQWSVPEPTRIALMNSLAERFNQSQKDFAVQIEYVPQAQARQKLISATTGGSPPDLCPGLGQLGRAVQRHGRGRRHHRARKILEALR